MVSRWSSRGWEIIKKRSSTLGLEVRVGDLGLGLGLGLGLRLPFGVGLL
jgi:hypothetical protein